MPDSIKVNISALQLGQAIHVKELTLPPGVRALNDPDAIVVQVKTPTVEAEAGAVAGESGAEPEIVGRRVKAEEPEAK
jgi:large subunit ribosomal protein L25